MIKDDIKNSLTIEQVEDFVANYGGEPQNCGSYLVCATICHNKPGHGSHKLYYYDNTKLFRCFTECDDSFDIFELWLKIRKQQGFDDPLISAIEYVAGYFNLTAEFDQEREFQFRLPDFDIFQSYRDIKVKKEQRIIELPEYDGSFLKNFPRPVFSKWKREGISKEVCDNYGICYNPISHGIVIPHFSAEDRLVGIRERTLVQENEKLYGKYRPMFFGDVLYRHPLGYNLYNYSNAKYGISKLSTAIIFEGEKSCLKYASLFPNWPDISVACCGSNISQYQIELLKQGGASEIIIALDKQFKEIGDQEWKQWTKKLQLLHTKYGNEVQISYLFDLDNLLGYKDSPIDCGKEKFLELFYNRRRL